MMAVTLATLRDSSWTTVYNHLQTGTYAISTDNIFSAWSDTLVNTRGYPIVIIESPKVTNTKINLNRDNIKQCDVSINIMIYHNTSASVKSLTDEVANMLDTGWRVLNTEGLKNLEFLEGDADVYVEAGKKVHVMNVPVAFRYVGK